MTDCFLITRFNLPLYKKDKERQPVLTEQWLDDRFRLFETYCLPSIQQQTYKDFVWIVLMSDDTPQMYRQRMSELCYQCRQLSPLYIKNNDIERYHDIVKDKIRELKSQSSLLVTLRIDNDDAIRCDYIERSMTLAQEQAESRRGYSFVYGIQYHTQANLAMRVPYPNNHFIFEINTQYKADDFDYILEYNHANTTDMPFPFTAMMDKEVMWAEVIHQRNVDNDVKGTWRQRPVTDNKLLKDAFGWSQSLSALNTWLKIPGYLMPAALHHAINRLREKMRK